MTFLSSDGICKRLEELEYLLVHRGSRGHSLEYELLYDGELDTDQRRMMGLIDVASLYDAEKSEVKKKKLGTKRQKTVPSQAQVRPKSGPTQGVVRVMKTAAKPLLARLSGRTTCQTPKTDISVKIMVRRIVTPHSL